MAEQQSHTRSKCCNLGKCEVDENDLPLDDVQSQIYKQRWKYEAGNERPFHDLPCELKVRAHLVPANPAARVFTRLSIVAMYVEVPGRAPGCCGISSTL